MQLSTAVRNAILDAIEVTISTSAKLKIFQGAVPADCAAADTGGTNPLASMDLPSDWMDAAASGAKPKLGTFEDTSADNSGTATHFRLYATDGTTCHAQGTITATGGGGDMELDNVSISAGQAITITTFTFLAGNA